MLSNRQKQLLFDYCIGLVSEQAAAEAERLISSNEQAAELHMKLKSALAPLENTEPERCPDALAESTILRLSNLARSSQLRLEQLLAGEQARKVAVKGWFWPKLGRIITVAAVITIFASVLPPSLRFMRHQSRNPACQAQLAQIFHGLSNYISDHDDRLPTVATTTGSPWWKVGCPGEENQSNTRHIWLLVKGDYVKPAYFVCPGRKQPPTVPIDYSRVKNYNDFPNRRYITYSLRIRCESSPKQFPPSQKALMADLNPLFEKLPESYSGALKLRLNKDLLTLNSINHGRRGQNVLFCDGNVRFVKVRNIGITGDDIFTIKDTEVYQGVELPSSDSDAFLAP